MGKTIVVPTNEEYNNLVNRYNFTEDTKNQMLQLYGFHRGICNMVLAFVDQCNTALYDTFNQRSISYDWSDYKLTDIIVCQRNEPNSVKKELAIQGWDIPLPIGFVNGVFVQLSYVFNELTPLGTHEVDRVVALELWTETRDGDYQREVHFQL